MGLQLPCEVICYQLEVNGLIYAYTVNKLEFILKHGFTTTL